MARPIYWHFSDMLQKPAAIPVFALYGEDDWQAPAGFAHIETIASRSALHDWHITPHRHDREVQLLLVREGPALVTLDDTLFRLEGPAFIVVPCDVVHGFRFTPETSGHVLTLSQEFAARARGSGDPLAQWLARGGHGPIPEAQAARVEWLAEELTALARDGLAADPLFAALAEALVRLLAVGGASLPGDHRLALFRHLVQTHMGEHRDLAFYARSLGVTTRTLTRLCRDHLGSTPQALINRRLALEAQRLLRYTDASVTAIAADLGFADLSYFSRFYLRMTGHRPQAERLATIPEGLRDGRVTIRA